MVARVGYRLVAVGAEQVVSSGWFATQAAVLAEGRRVRQDGRVQQVVLWAEGHPWRVQYDRVGQRWRRWVP
jgi:hypothetical protein